LGFEADFCHYFEILITGDGGILLGVVHSLEDVETDFSETEKGYAIFK